MKKLRNTEAKLKKNVAYKKIVWLQSTLKIFKDLYRY